MAKSVNKPKTKTATAPVDDTWATLTAWVTTVDDEAVLQTRLDLEIRGKNRKMYVMRLHSRLNKLRGRREKAALLASAR